MRIVATTAGTALLLMITAGAASADTLSDFERAAGSRNCNLSPYSGIRSDCRRAYKRATDRADKINCSRLVVLPLIAQLRAAKASLKAEKSKKKPNRSQISNLERRIRKLERKIKERKAKAKKRHHRASRVVKNFDKARRVMGSRLKSKIRRDIRRALDKAKRAQKDKSRHAKLMARYAKITAFASQIKAKVSGFRSSVLAKRGVAKAHEGVCRKVARGAM